MDGVGLKWTEPKADRWGGEHGTGLGSDPPLQPPDLVLQCLCVLRFLQPALSPALQQQRSPLSARLPELSGGCTNLQLALSWEGKGRETSQGPQSLLSPAEVSPTHLWSLCKGVGKPLSTRVTSSSKETNNFY